MDRQIYENALNCLKELRGQLVPAESQSYNVVDGNAVKTSSLPQDPKSTDIVVITAERINSGQVNIYDDAEVNWEEVTMFNVDNIKRLLAMVDTKFLADTGESITMSLAGKYEPSWLFYKPDVHSRYYDPSDSVLPEEGDWDYVGIIKNYVDTLTQKREKAEAYKRKLSANKAADEFLYTSAEVFISKLNADPDFTNKMKIVSKSDWERQSELIKQQEKRIEELTQNPVKVEVPIVEEPCGKTFVFDDKTSLKTTAKNQRYLLCKLAMKAFGVEKLTEEQYELLNFITGLKEGSNTISSMFTKIGKGADGELLPAEMPMHRNLNEKYKLPKKNEAKA